jgi:hypothetical protein
MGERKMLLHMTLRIQKRHIRDAMKRLLPNDKNRRGGVCSTCIISQAVGEMFPEHGLICTYNGTSTVYGKNTATIAVVDFQHNAKLLELSTKDTFIQEGFQPTTAKVKVTIFAKK